MPSKKQVLKTHNVVPLKPAQDQNKKSFTPQHNPRLTDPGVRKIGHNMKAQVPRYRKAG